MARSLEWIWHHYLSQLGPVYHQAIAMHHGNPCHCLVWKPLYLQVIAMHHGNPCVRTPLYLVIVWSAGHFTFRLLLCIMETPVFGNPCYFAFRSFTCLLAWSGFEAVKTAPWRRRGLQNFGKLIEPSDEWAGRGCCCFLMRWHSWVFLAHQEWAPKTCWAQIWIFQF